MPNSNSYPLNQKDSSLPTNYPVTVLLDDQTTVGHERRSRLYQGLREQLLIDSPYGLPDALAELQAGLDRGLHAVMLLDYELGVAMQGLPAREQAPEPISQILLFDSVKLLTGAEVDEWLQNQDPGASATLTGLRSSIDEACFAGAVDQIRRRIADGETYQVNLCFAMHMALYGSPVALYRALRRHQAVPYGALIGLADGRWVLSRSPELFVRHQNSWIESQPMKGTAAVDSKVDLANDPKNRAENVMIVDLLRNDLGRVARPGSVSVPDRFEIKRYGNVLQMTSTVRAQLRADVSWVDLLEAIFPCGSITGAPKHSTMQIIRDIEPTARGIYTGAIGWIEPAGKGQLGNFCLSVPIRTLTLSAPDKQGKHSGMLGVGAGITWGSDSATEWAECMLKASFLTRLTTPLTLFETMRASRQHGIANVDRHLARLQASANALDFMFDAHAARQKLQATCDELPDDADYRVRLDLAADGHISIKTGPLNRLPSSVKVLLAPETMDSGDLYLRHKTSNRALYDAAWQQAEQQGAFDMLFFNERDELTEGARTNVFIKLDGRWYTPPLTAGVLPGVMRGILLEDPALAASERTITRRELQQAQAVLICNALRGAIAAELIDKHMPTTPSVR
ncbi:MAG: chorismate-binding protein [Burkholderiaceae bacterium]|nr:chorismate-binding protein [Burkholderiaceae bacterium]